MLISSVSSDGRKNIFILGESFLQLLHTDFQAHISSQPENYEIVTVLTY